jgi:hypothetical protein
MRSIFLIAAICSCSISYTQRIIVFSKTEKCFLEARHNVCNPAEVRKVEFMNNFINNDFRDTLQMSKARLITPPLEWGKKVSDTTYGEFVYNNSFAGGFITDLNLFNLIPDQTYLLTLNGNPKLEGNNLLPDTVPNMPNEKYYDFLSIKTDLHGKYHARIAVYLKQGDYQVRFYVKDTDRFKIVLYHDFFKFKVY